MQSYIPLRKIIKSRSDGAGPAPPPAFAHLHLRSTKPGHMSSVVYIALSRYAVMGTSLATGQLAHSLNIFRRDSLSGRLDAGAPRLVWCIALIEAIIPVFMQMLTLSEGLAFSLGVIAGIIIIFFFAPARAWRFTLFVWLINGGNILLYDRRGRFV